eukprot:COSAG02_NODE_1568_length_11897_cov_632.076454_8_plen_87_part_00
MRKLMPGVTITFQSYYMSVVSTPHAAAAEGTWCRMGTLRERALGGAHVDYNNVQRYYTITLLSSALPVFTMSAPGTPDPAATPWAT